MTRAARIVPKAPRAQAVMTDSVVSFQIVPGTLEQFLEARGEEGGPRLKCFEGSVTLVSPGMLHESKGHRLTMLVFAVCMELRIQRRALSSTTWKLPKGSKDTAYEADQSYYIQSVRTARDDQVPDLALEVVVTHEATKALRCGELLGIPEMWVFDDPRRRLNFHHLVIKGQRKASYELHARSRAFPFLDSNEVLEQLDDSEVDDSAFHENCRAWAKRVLVPRRRAEKGGV